jgi:nicotinate phosphoribosyltransferase
MRTGARTSSAPTLGETRSYALSQLALMPDALRELEGELRYPVRIAPAIHALADAVDRENR